MHLKSMHNQILGRFGQNWFLVVNVHSNKIAAIAYRFIGLVIFYSFIVRLSFYLCVGVKHSFPCRHLWAVMLELKRSQMASSIFGKNENTCSSHSIQFSNISFQNIQPLNSIQTTIIRQLSSHYLLTWNAYYVPKCIPRKWGRETTYIYT